VLAKSVVCCVVLVAMSFELQAADPADLVLRGGKIVTVDDSRPAAEALAVHADRIAAVGSNGEIEKLIGPDTRVIELEGKLAVPGFIEGHGHFTWLGQSRMMLDLKPAKSWDDLVTIVDAAARKAGPGEWILGNGWHQEKWRPPPEPHVQGYPIHDKLSRATPRNPVLLTHSTGHMSLANAEAMRLAGVTGATPDPPGGEILKDGGGNPTGVFRETAQSLVSAAMTEARGANLQKAIELAEAECLASGVTSFQDAGSSFAAIDALKETAARGELKVRLWVMVREGNSALARKMAAYRMIGFGDDHLTVRAIKRSVDGALGSHGAWLLAPYDDLPESTGLNTTSIESIRETAELAIQHDYQLCVHAIGDRANREILDLFEEMLREPAFESRRWRIEHAQHLHADDIPRFARLEVIASMQGVHCTSDAPFVIERLGRERARVGAYAWQSLLESGAVVTNGTDAPVEDLSPIASFYATVTRRLPDGSTFFPEQRMTREQALRSYTLDAAYAAFEEEIKGSLTPGKLADIVVLSKDIMTVPDDEIPGAEVVMTIVGGKVLYDRGR
jgi:predicted amidohydrolase YtcJ